MKNDVSETVLLISESKYSSQFEIELENCLIRPKQKSRDFSIFLKGQFHFISYAELLVTHESYLWIIQYDEFNIFEKSLTLNRS